MNFWQKLPKPIIGLSPMDGVSDAPFRFITAKYGEPDVTITEFISVDGIVYGAKRLYTDFLYHENERPVVAQIFGNDPDLFYQAAKVVCELGFDGLDVNMGCPAKSVAARGAGAALVETPDLAVKILEASKQGVADWAKSGMEGLPKKVLSATDETKKTIIALGNKLEEERKPIPVSVKTRIGFKEVVIEPWITSLLKAKPANITVHGRTLKQMYMGQADWGALKRGKQVVDQYNKGKADDEQITYIGNGDITSAEVANQRITESGVDGVLIGRASFGNPWIFKEVKGNHEEISLNERIRVAIEHSKVHEDVKGHTPFVQMRKHLSWYMKGFPGAAAIRMELMQTQSSEEVEKILSKLQNN